MTNKTKRFEFYNKCEEWINVNPRLQMNEKNIAKSLIWSLKICESNKQYEEHMKKFDEDIKKWSENS